MSIVRCSKCQVGSLSEEKALLQAYGLLWTEILVGMKGCMNVAYREGGLLLELLVRFLTHDAHSEPSHGAARWRVRWDDGAAICSRLNAAGPYRRRSPPPLDQTRPERGSDPP